MQAAYGFAISRGIGVAELRLLSTMGLAGVVRKLGPGFEAARGLRLDATFEPTLRIMARIRAGERGDVAIVTEEGIGELLASGLVTGRTDLARSFVGVAVRAGAPHPDISTPEAFVAALLGAKSVAMSQAGASGIFMAGLLRRLGIAEAVAAKATILSSGFTAELAASGAVEIAIQQVSELMVVPGVEIVGRLPREIESVTIFSAGAFREALQPHDAGSLVAELASPAHAEIYRACGLEPAGTGTALRA
jgi:molybdate transport system substrate-binding protein